MIDFKITPDEGAPFEVNASTRDILMWERTTKGGSLKKLLEQLLMGDLYKVAYLAAKRTGQFEGTQKDFESTVDLDFEIENDDEDDDSDPSSL